MDDERVCACDEIKEEAFDFLQFSLEFGGIASIA